MHSVPRILACLLPACLAAALGGAVLVVVEFHGSALQALMTWPPSELVNYLGVLPAMLTVRPRWRRRSRPRATARGDRWKVWPALLLAASCVATVAFDGPGSIMFRFLACSSPALTYSVPVMSLLTMALGAGCLTMLCLGAIDIGQNMAVPEMVVSVRIAVAFLVLVPLTISSAMAVRDDLLDQLREAADHDGLTGLLNRRAFEQRVHDRLDMALHSGRSFVVLWLDIDHFKSINDRYEASSGRRHAAGFRRERPRLLPGRRSHRTAVRERNSRWSPRCSAPGRGSGCETRLSSKHSRRRGHPLGWRARLRATVGIGACHVDRAQWDVAHLVGQLDEALYRAKRKGRNRIEWLPDGASEHLGERERLMDA